MVFSCLISEFYVNVKFLSIDFGAMGKIGKSGDFERGAAIRGLSIFCPIVTTIVTTHKVC